MLADFRFALRLLARAPGFTVAVVFIMALGVGANSAVFTALDQTASVKSGSGHRAAPGMKQLRFSDDILAALRESKGPQIIAIKYAKDLGSPKSRATTIELVPLSSSNR